MEDGCSNISREEHTEDHSDKNDEIGTKMNRLEVEIKEACEVENYDRAGEDVILAPLLLLIYNKEWFLGWEMSCRIHPKIIYCIYYS